MIRRRHAGKRVLGDGIAIPIEEWLSQLATRVFRMGRLVHVDVDMWPDDAHRSPEVGWRGVASGRRIMCRTISPVHRFGCLFQCQRHSDFSLPTCKPLKRIMCVFSSRSFLATVIYVCLPTQKPLAVQLAGCATPASFCHRSTKPTEPLPAGGLSIGGESHLSAALILLFGATGHGDRAHDIASLHDGERAPSGHDATAARYNQALKPCLPSNARQVFSGLLEASCRVSFIKCDVHGDGTGAIHSAERDHAAALINNYRGDLDVQL